MAKPSKKHHFVPQAQLRHFAADAARKSIWVFDKSADRAFRTSILNAGSENDFNTVDTPAGKWNFEDIFRAVDTRSARLISAIITAGSVGWLQADDRVALIDLFATQMLRTHFARTSPRYLARAMRDMVRRVGYDPDTDPSMAMPSAAQLRLSAARSFLKRGRIAQSMVRLVPVLFAAPPDRLFFLSDDPVAATNAFPYGDAALTAHGVIIFLPISPALGVALICPTIIERYEAIDRAVLAPEKRARMIRHRDGFRSGGPVTIEAAELDGWNGRQIARSARYLYASTPDFEAARQMLVAHPELRLVESHMQVGEMGRPPPPRSAMPSGTKLVINGKADHCMLSIAEIDQDGEGLTARTTDLMLLELVAADTGELRADLYEDGQIQRSIGAATVEPLADRDTGWFRVVHRDESLRALMHQLDREPASRT